MERRVFERIPVNIYVRFYHSRLSYTGIVSNLSKNGLCIETKTHFPLKSELEIFVFARGESLKIPVSVTVNRFIEDSHLVYGLGNELIEQPPNYKKIVDSFTHNNFLNSIFS